MLSACMAIQCANLWRSSFFIRTERNYSLRPCNILQPWTSIEDHLFCRLQTFNLEICSMSTFKDHLCSMLGWFLFCRSMYLLCMQSSYGLPTTHESFLHKKLLFVASAVQTKALEPYGSEEKVKAACVVITFIWHLHVVNHRRSSMICLLFRKV